MTLNKKWTCTGARRWQHHAAQALDTQHLFTWIEESGGKIASRVTGASSPVGYGLVATQATQLPAALQCVTQWVYLKEGKASLPYKQAVTVGLVGRRVSPPLC